ncbi:hypothetical protein DSOUD_0632 [Desulfuromonas soudanensis]|uniref:Lipoprotein n=1 Tax=Desulfuromonas soudanensis TaxID=1603606 RepID=A0A0M4DFU6_9BACT|nr:hypothetical protein [Desulfuromonas soudanensis]ALC15420.1 hypothetical protein DSOUD_0632 [Desulfuromonas soudanensis]
MLNPKVLPASALFVLLLLLAACSSEPKAVKALEQAEAVAAAGNLAGAIPLYEAVVADYPKSKAAVKAETGLRAIRLTLAREKGELTEALGSVRDVLEGFASMYGDYPKSLADLDNGEYFFDGSYLAGVVPGDARVYLLFAEAPPYRVWAFKNGREEGLSLDASAAETRSAVRSEALAALEAAGPPVVEIGALAAYGRPDAGKSL